MGLQVEIHLRSFEISASKIQSTPDPFPGEQLMESNEAGHWARCHARLSRSKGQSDCHFSN